MATKKHPGRVNRKNPKKQAVKKLPEVRAEQPAVSEGDREFIEKYSKGNVLVNVLKIWRDTSPRWFLTFFPVVALQLLYSFVFFTAQVVMFVPMAEQTAAGLVGAVYNINKFVAAFALPVVLSLLHLIYNIKNKKYFFFNSLIYIIPGCAVYALLDFVSGFLAYAFTAESLGRTVVENLGYSGIVVAGAVIMSLLAGAACQLVLTLVRNRRGPISTKLGAVIPEDKIVRPEKKSFFKRYR